LQAKQKDVLILLIHQLAQDYILRAPFGGQGVDFGRCGEQIILLLFPKIKELSKKKMCIFV
jgi:hypothetical protein